MNYREALGWYRSFEKFGVVPGLERTKALCAALGDPQKDFDCVHITGTNGKGSTCTEVSCVLKAAGYKTALYTSPEVIDFRERMQINGKMISEDALCLITEKVKKTVEKLNDEGVFPTQFEVLTAAAFTWFSENNCDIAVLETGLGGRFDATNIIEKPLVCAVTSVSLDHMAILGDTYEKIAYEKCGIIKPGAAVISVASQREDVKRVIENAARANGSEAVFADREKLFSVFSEDITGSNVLFTGMPLKVPFTGRHQLENAAAAVEICFALRSAGYQISDDDIRRGIEAARIPARTEILKASPLVMIDGSHNDGSTSALARVLEKFLSGKRVLAMMGMMADKECERSVSNLIAHFSEVIAVTPSNPRAMRAEKFADIVSSFGVPCTAVQSPSEGLRLAAEKLADFDALIICGSLYLAADIRAEAIKLFT